MFEWNRLIQYMVDEIDRGLQCRESDALTLQALASRLGYSTFHTTRKFREISGMQFREYLRRRQLAFALKEVRDSQRPLLDIALWIMAFPLTRHSPTHLRQPMALRPPPIGKRPALLCCAPRSIPLTDIYLDLERSA